MRRLLKNDAFQFLSLSSVITLLVCAIDVTKGMVIAKTVYLTFFEVLDIIVAVSISSASFRSGSNPRQS